MLGVGCCSLQLLQIAQHSTACKRRTVQHTQHISSYYNEFSLSRAGHRSPCPERDTGAHRGALWLLCVCVCVACPTTSSCSDSCDMCVVVLHSTLYSQSHVQLSFLSPSKSPSEQGCCRCRLPVVPYSRGSGSCCHSSRVGEWVGGMCSSMQQKSNPAHQIEFLCLFPGTGETQFPVQDRCSVATVLLPKPGLCGFVMATHTHTHHTTTFKQATAQHLS